MQQSWDLWIYNIDQHSMTVMHMSLGVGKVDRTLVDTWTAWYPARDVRIVLSHQIEFNGSNDMLYII